MRTLHLRKGALCAVSLALIALTISACGSSSGDATKLLQQTFGGSHKVNSGNLSLNLAIDPSGSTTLKGPITLSFGGPFQSLGQGKLPQSNFNVSISALGRSGSLGILSTGTNGYVTLQGTSYQLPQSTFQRVESSFSQITSSGTRGSGSSTLSKLGIHPLDWLKDPTIVGDETVSGTSTTHIRARVNVSALLDDLNTFLQKASTLGVSGASSLSGGISPSTRSRIASEIQNPSFDVWTGKSDKTIRKLQIKLTLPVTGQISTVLGGMRSAAIGLTMQYANLNQPQTITAPTNVRPYSEFTAKVQSFLQSLQSGLGGLSGAAGSGGASSGSSGSSGGGSSNGSIQAYTQCVQAAGSDVTKLQQCAPLLNGGK
jgi:hypothetical protein